VRIEVGELLSQLEVPAVGLRIARTRRRTARISSVGGYFGTGEPYFSSVLVQVYLRIARLHVLAVDFSSRFAQRKALQTRGGTVYTNINIDTDLMDQAMRATGLRTKTKVVEAALRALLLLKEQREIRDLRGRLHWQGTETLATKGKSGANPR
jgi:Arc/MetJ family transcription regulator